MIAACNVTKCYRGETIPAVAGFSFAFPDTGLFFLTGPSGAGKSTIAAILGGMDSAFTGTVEACGRKLHTLSAAALADFRLENVGFAFQGGYLEGPNRVLAEVAKPLDLLAWPAREKKAAARRLLAELGLSGLAHRQVLSLSGGEKKRVALAKALIKKPAVVILDEPTANLNRRLFAPVMALIRKAAASSLVLVITHDLELVEPADGLLTMADGRIVSARPPQPAEIPVALAKAGSGRRRNWLGGLWVKAWRGLAANGGLVGPAILAMAVAISAAGLATLLVGGVGGGLHHLTGNALDSLAVVARPPNRNRGRIPNVLADAACAGAALSLAPDCATAWGTAYFRDVNDVFTPASGFAIALDGWTYPQSLGLNLLAEAGLLANYGPFDFLPTAESRPLSATEVCLAAPPPLLALLMEKAGTPGDEAGFGQVVDAGRLTLAVTARIPQVQGPKTATVRIRAVCRGPKIQLLHTSPFFAERFFEGTLGMLASADLDALDPVPYTLKKGGVVYVRRTALGTFFRRFAVAESFRDKVLVKGRGDPAALAIPLFIGPKRFNEARPADGLRLFLDESLGIDSLALSNPVYALVAGGLRQGFAVPLFVSGYRARLNQVIEQNKRTELDLRGYAFAAGELPEGVFSSSLADSLRGQGLFFATSFGNRKLLGSFPRSDREIAVSAGLARRLYGTPEKALGRNLAFLMLDKVAPVAEGYANTFAEGTFRVAGVVAGEAEGLYHDPFFPLAFAFANMSWDADALLCDAFVLHFDTPASRDRGLGLLPAVCPQYDFAAPLKEMADTLDRTLARLALFLGLFAALAIILATFLLALTLYLVVKKGEQEAGDMLALGYRPRQVRTYYVLFSLLIGILAALQSAAGLFAARKAASQTLAATFPGYVPTTGIWAYLLAFSIAVVLSGLVGFLVFVRTAGLSPLKAFRRGL